jgi:hypothetical protein
LKQWLVVRKLEDPHPGYCVYLGDNIVSWSSKRQVTIGGSLAHSLAEAVWLHQLLVELRRPMERATIVYCENVSAIYMASIPVQ